METESIYQIGDRVQAYDGRIGIIINIKENTHQFKIYNIQNVVVKLTDGSLMIGASDKFKPLSVCSSLSAF